MNNQAYHIFQKGSKTFYYSSYFFPPSIRNDIAVFYAFVRTADNHVDSIPQQKQSFLTFQKLYYTGRKKPTGNPIIDNFISLEQSNHFPLEWSEAFLDAMKMDLSKKTYSTIEETEQYMYGSAEVIGLFLARIMKLPETAYPAAQLLGKSLQFINFLRDIKEDLTLGRQYLPTTDIKGFGLSSLKESHIRTQTSAFTHFMRFEIERYHVWQSEAEQGFRFLPRRYRIPVQTASDLYRWTAVQLYNNPLIVYSQKVKPSRRRIISRGIMNLLKSLAET